MSWKDVMEGYLNEAPESGQTRAVAADVRSERVRLWRRRVLSRRGARMRTAMGLNADSYSLAMLDENGVVVSWYDRADANDRVADRVVDRHVSQFYVPEDVACKQPIRDLHAATIDGSNTRLGWRRRPDGRAFWGTTVIEAILLRDGRLQGFSYVTRESGGPSASLPIAQSMDLPRAEENRDWRPGMHEVEILPAWDRMARSRSMARQRRLFRFVRRMRTPECELSTKGMRH